MPPRVLVTNPVFGNTTTGDGSDGNPVEVNSSEFGGFFVNDEAGNILDGDGSEAEPASVVIQLNPFSRNLLSGTGEEGIGLLAPNHIAAYCTVDALGALQAGSFNCASASRAGLGHYEIVLSTPVESTQIAVDINTTYTSAVNASWGQFDRSASDPFTMVVRLFNVQDGVATAFDAPFSFSALGGFPP